MGRRAVITIDGPAGAGKSTVGRLLAQTLGYHYLDSGALYRLVAWQVGRLGVNPSDESDLTVLLEGLETQIITDDGGFHIWYGGRELSQELRTPNVSDLASQVAKVPRVRRWVTKRLRALAQDGGVVAEGRDLGSVVFPDAQAKFYLDAALPVRAARRRREWQEQGADADLQDALAALAERDRRDQHRSESPLTIPPAAQYIDTSHLTPAEVVARCLDFIRRVTGEEPEAIS